MRRILLIVWEVPISANALNTRLQIAFKIFGRVEGSGFRKEEMPRNYPLLFRALILGSLL